MDSVTVKTDLFPYRGPNLIQEFGSRWMSIERESIWTVRVTNKCYVYFFPKSIYKFME